MLKIACFAAALLLAAARQQPSFKTGVDLVAVACGFFLSSLFRFTPDRIISALASPSGITMVVLTTLLWVAMLSAREAYAPRTMVSGLDQLVRVASALLPAWILTQLLAFLLKETIPFESRLVMAFSFPAVSLFLLAERFWVV